jgi:hypothetical protein
LLFRVAWVAYVDCAAVMVRYVFSTSSAMAAASARLDNPVLSALSPATTLLLSSVIVDACERASRIDRTVCGEMWEGGRGEGKR